MQCSTGHEAHAGVLDVGRYVIATATDTGTVSIWDKNDGSLMYQERHHGEHQSVWGVTVTDQYVLTGAEDGSLVILEKLQGDWTVSKKMYENKETITHLGSDGKWVAIGTRNTIKLLDIEEQKMVEKIPPVHVRVWMLSFVYPHAFVVGGNDWEGVQVWDMNSGVQTRYILQNGKHFHNIHIGGRFLTVSECNNTRTRDTTELLTVTVYDINEILDTRTDTKKLWKRSFNFPQGGHYENINAVSNTTSLLVSHGSKLEVLNFWKDQK